MNTGRIEALVNDRLTRVYFPKKPVCKYLSEQAKVAFQNSVERDSAQAKILGFLKEIPNLIDNMKHVEKLSRALIQITPSKISFIRDLSTLISFIINVLMIIYYKQELVPQTDGSSVYQPVIVAWASDAISWLGLLQCITSLTMLIGWLYT